VSVAAAPNEFSSESNFTTIPKGQSQSIEEDIHNQNTQILGDGRGRSAPPVPRPATGPRDRPRTGPPPPPRPTGGVRPIYEDLHAAPTMIIDIGRLRQRRRTGRG
jgi:hypothetical protein